MKVLILLLTALGLMAHSALAATRGAHQAHLTCGPFQVAAITQDVTPIVRPGEDQYPAVKHATAQSIHFVNRSQHVALDLDLKQQRSPDPGLRGQPSLDGVAYAWRCDHADPRDAYLIVEFYCTHTGSSCICPQDAGVCRDDGLSPTAQWTQAFDVKGQPVMHHPMTVSQEDAARLRARGLWPRIWSNHVHLTNIFPYKLSR